MIVMSLPEFKAWVEGMRAAGVTSHQLLLDRIGQKLKDECAPPPVAPGFDKMWPNPADHVPKTPGGYIIGPFGPEQPM